MNLPIVWRKLLFLSKLYCRIGLYCHLVSWRRTPASDLPRPLGPNVSSEPVLALHEWTVAVLASLLRKLSKLHFNTGHLSLLGQVHHLQNSHKQRVEFKPGRCDKRSWGGGVVAPVMLSSHNPAFYKWKCKNARHGTSKRLQNPFFLMHVQEGLLLNPDF